jgi:hypothetical protein
VYSSFCDDFDFIRNGEYATYHDTRGGIDFLRMYWGNTVEDGSLIFYIRNIDNQTSEEFKYIVLLKEDENGSPEIIEVHGYNKEQAPVFQQSVYDLLNFLDFYNSNRDSIKGDMELEDPWENYTQIYHINDFFPVFHFDKIYLKGQDQIGYRLVDSGRIHDHDYNYFFDLPLLDNTKIESRSNLTIPPTTKRDLSLYDYDIILDENWSFNDELGHPGYWLSLYSIRDSQIMLEKGDWDHFQNLGFQNIEDFIYAVIYNKNNRNLSSGFTIIQSGDVYTVGYYLIDELNQLNYQEARFWIEDGLLYTLNFSTFADMYDLNKEYYRNILDSFR